MAISFVESSATISTTERSLPANTTTGVPTAQTTVTALDVWLDTANIAAGDIFIMTLYEKINSGGTQRTVKQWYIVGGSIDGPYIARLPILGNGWDITLKKSAGTDRTIAWSLREVT